MPPTDLARAIASGDLDAVPADALAEWATAQRWFSSKLRDVREFNVLDVVVLSRADPVVAIVIAEASPQAHTGHCTAKFLTQAGVANDFIRLETVGISGNGHMMMLERNSAEIARFLMGWLAARGLARFRRRLHRSRRGGRPARRPQVGLSA